VIILSVGCEALSLIGLMRSLLRIMRVEVFPRVEHTGLERVLAGDSSKLLEPAVKRLLGSRLFVWVGGAESRVPGVRVGVLN